MYVINVIMIPVITPIPYTKLRIVKFSFIFLFDLNNTRIATPLPVSNPDITEAKFIELLKYNSVSITLDAQLGIKPIKLVMNGDIIVSFNNSFGRYSSPNSSNTRVIINVAMKMNINVFIVCIKLDLNKFSSSQPQCSSSQIEYVCFSFFLFLSRKSIMKPDIKPTINLVPSNGSIVLMLAFLDRRIINISSLVDK